MHPLRTPEDQDIAAHPERDRIGLLLQMAVRTPPWTPEHVVAAYLFQVSLAAVTEAQRAAVWRWARRTTTVVSGAPADLARYFRRSAGGTLIVEPLDQASLRREHRAGRSFAFAYYDPEA